MSKRLDKPVCYSIGHSNHTSDKLVALLRGHGIQTLVDVRSRPYSRYVPYFSYEPLQELLARAGFHYIFLGKELGGKPSEMELYEESGPADYAAIAATDVFHEGLRRLLVLLKEAPTAVMCAEEDPARCHRQHLIAPALEARGVEVRHIRGDGRLEGADLKALDAPRQGKLF